MKLSQAWSLDIMLAIVIFLGTAFFFFAILNSTQGDKTDELKEDAARVIEDIVSENSDLGIVDENKINVTKLEELLGRNYSDIKRKLRIKNDFCLYFEDEKGNIIYINTTYTGVGSSIINVSNVTCG